MVEQVPFHQWWWWEFSKTIAIPSLEKKKHHHSIALKILPSFRSICGRSTPEYANFIYFNPIWHFSKYKVRRNRSFPHPDIVLQRPCLTHKTLARLVAVLLCYRILSVYLSDYLSAMIFTLFCQLLQNEKQNPPIFLFLKCIGNQERERLSPQVRDHKQSLFFAISNYLTFIRR